MGKLQTRHLVGEGVPQLQNRKYPAVIKIWSWVPEGRQTPKETGLLTVVRKMTYTSKKNIRQLVQESAKQNRLDIRQADQMSGSS
jgi:hypothetical protein